MNHSREWKRAVAVACGIVLTLVIASMPAVAQEDTDLKADGATKLADGSRVITWRIAPYCNEVSFVFQGMAQDGTDKVFTALGIDDNECGTAQLPTLFAGNFYCDFAGKRCVGVVAEKPNLRDYPGNVGANCYLDFAIPGLTGTWDCGALGGGSLVPLAMERSEEPSMGPPIHGVVK